MSNMQANRRTRPGWEEWELALLKDRNMTDEKIAEKLPKRTVKGVNVMRRKLRTTAFRKCRFCGKEGLRGRNTIYCPQHQRSQPSWKSVAYGAKARGIPFTLTLDEFESLIWNKPCVYCGETPRGYGIDRIDNNQGYHANNVIPCCIRCNRSKGDMSVIEWVKQMRVVLKRLEDGISGHRSFDEVKK